MSLPLHKEAIFKMLSDQKINLSEFGVEQIGLFGSYLRNEATENSDIDLLVDLSKDRKTFRNFMALNYFLEDLFGSRVDLITKQSLSPFTGPHILKSVEYVSFTG